MNYQQSSSRPRLQTVEKLIKNLSPEQMDDLKRELYLARCELAREDVNEFIELCFKDDDTQLPIQQAWFHRKMQLFLPVNQPANVLFLLPRGAGKSQQISVYRVVWELGVNPNLRIKIITATDNTAVEIVAGIKKAIVQNEHVRNVFPHLRPSKTESWSTHQITVERESGTGHPSVEACSVLGTGAGGRSDLNVYDDVCDLMNSVLRPTEREKVKRAIRETWKPMLVPKSRAVWIATPYHHDDATNTIRQSGMWRKLVIPAVIPKDTDIQKIIDSDNTAIEIPAAGFDDGMSYWPEKWPLDMLLEKKSESPRSFDRQYLLKATTDDDRIFAFSDIIKCVRQDIVLGDTRNISPDWPRYAGVDLAASLNKKAAYTVMFTIAVDDDGIRWPVEIIRRRQRFPDTINMIIDQYKKHGHVFIRVENNAYQQSVIDQISRLNIDIPIVAHHTGVKKMDEEIGLPSIAAQLSRGLWVIPINGCADIAPDGGLDLRHGDDCPTCAWLTEMIEAPSGKYIDTLMAMWMADAAARQRNRNKLGCRLESKIITDSRIPKPTW